jgi:hypothetical protein
MLHCRYLLVEELFSPCFSLLVLGSVEREIRLQGWDGGRSLVGLVTTVVVIVRNERGLLFFEES